MFYPVQTACFSINLILFRFPPLLNRITEVSTSRAILLTFYVFTFSGWPRVTWPSRTKGNVLIVEWTKTIHWTQCTRMHFCVIPDQQISSCFWVRKGKIHVINAAFVQRSFLFLCLFRVNVGLWVQQDTRGHQGPLVHLVEEAHQVPQDPLVLPDLQEPNSLQRWPYFIPKIYTHYRAFMIATS